jgi:putative transposase
MFQRKETLNVKGKRYTEQQIIRILQEIDGGQTVAETCRQYGVSEATVYRWKRQYRGMDESELRRLKELESENSRLKKIVAQQALDIDALKDLLGKEL